MKVDPRVKLFIVILISSFAIVLDDPIKMSLLLLVGLIVTSLFGGHYFKVLKKLRRILMVIFSLIIIQSIFNTEGRIILEVLSIKLLTDVGLLKGALYLLRVMIILVSGTILSTASETELIGALIKCHVPYDFSFMVALGIRFMPIFMDEFKDTMTAIELRGVHVKALKLKDKLDLYGYILTPIVIGALDKAKKLSLSIEMRGFRAMKKRSSHLSFKMTTKDYMMMMLTTLIVVLIV